MFSNLRKFKIFCSGEKCEILKRCTVTSKGFNDSPTPWFGLDLDFWFVCFF